MLAKKILSNHKFFSVLAKGFYNYYYSIKTLSHLRTNNFGYAPVDEEVAHYDPDQQHGIQLYKEVIRNHKGFLIDESCSVVEVGCGKGAGAEFLIKKFNPQKYTGIDFSKKAIHFCETRYGQINNADFICADAQNIPLEERSTDVVLNVESSHLYKSQDLFFNEVYRILKPNGRFLLTDFRYIKNSPIDVLEKDLLNSGFTITEKKIITPQIREACKELSERRKQFVNTTPRYLRKYFRHYAILNGTKKSRMLENGEIVYFIYHLEKNGKK
jgi:ubiquinone/menaquinone biosynthesis C-methylase UbiE